MGRLELNPSIYISANMMSKGEGKRRLPIGGDQQEDGDQEDGGFQGLGFGGDDNDDDYKEQDDDEEEEEEKGDSNYKKGTTSSSSRSTNQYSTVYCQAENCSAELSDAKRYHKRHKVCEFHAKSPHVLVSGIHQRFCQQCSRFHGLAEFDGSKRSCRRRLAGHNERRRKSTSE